MLIKTVEHRYADIERFIRERHSYDTPEIVAFASDGVSARYLRWLTDHVSADLA